MQKVWGKYEMDKQIYYYWRYLVRHPQAVIVYQIRLRSIKVCRHSNPGLCYIWYDVTIAKSIHIVTPIRTTTSKNYILIWIICDSFFAFSFFFLILHPHQLSFLTLYPSLLSLDFEWGNSSNRSRIICSWNSTSKLTCVFWAILQSTPALFIPPSLQLSVSFFFLPLAPVPFLKDCLLLENKT